MRRLKFFALFLIFTASSSHAQIRKVTAKVDSILTVKTALGIATIIQVPSTIQSAIIGDQSGFKVEYLDHAVTIKPLRWAAKTNLYLVTEKMRHNIRLQTGSQDQADYIVYVQSPEKPKPMTKWIKLNKSTSQHGMKLSVERIGIAVGGFLIFDCSLSTDKAHTLAVKPQDVWVRQKGQSKTINSLFLSDLKLQKKSPLKIGISLAKSDLIAGQPLTLEVQNKKMLSVTISESVWKQ